MDFPAEYTERKEQEGLLVSISKVGGGTIGKKYTMETWSYCVSRLADGHILLIGDDMYIGYPADHRKAVEVAMSYLEDEE